ncbi:hypothetical protein TWF569_009640 [Orbilia oligospora]|uniref:Uncharacterized protein n=1 Tax=Orbilia oligospora TaxID=2813651 RepID=A0A7C8NGW0_ORBOL|nr:hypothetical protein TWF706_011821 [Orbilia oligospora]KAF3111930.1 hypothetical protein TWF102_005691 [Orbilia oligospora]KAF3114615.1 hypothetical protein TWF103_001075 [Orbilia oligospora]KAF3135702.1 hypothetical protein TWF569_009640 [Orbilia oligospora]KAF3146474.1 hypothetical protein TWF594_003267 [Orbilia oligospora]
MEKRRSLYKQVWQDLTAKPSEAGERVEEKAEETMEETVGGAEEIDSRQRDRRPVLEFPVTNNDHWISVEKIGIALEYEDAQTETRGGSMRKAFPEELKGSENRAKSSIENVDGVDFRRRFNQLQVSDGETVPKHRAKIGVLAREVAVRTFSNRNENFSKDRNMVSNVSRPWKDVSSSQSQFRKNLKQSGRAEKEYSVQPETSTILQVSKEVESVEKRRNSTNPTDIETRAAEDLWEQLGYENEAQEHSQIPNLVPQNLPEASRSNFQIHEVLPADKNPFADVEVGQLGFVKYLFDKALDEIKRGNTEAAKPCIERLRSIDRTQRVIEALEDNYYGQIIVDGVSELRSDDLSLALSVLEQLKAPAPTKYKEILRREIADHLHRIALRLISASEYKEAFQIISKLEAQLKSWDTKDGPLGMSSTSGVPMGQQPEILKDSAGSHIKSKAIAHVEAGEYTQAVALLRILDGNSYDRQRIDICKALARSFLAVAEQNVRDENLDLVWTNIFRADVICNAADSWPDYLSLNGGDFIRTIVQVPDARDKLGAHARKLAIDGVYTLPSQSGGRRPLSLMFKNSGRRRGVTRSKDIVEARLSILQQVRSTYEKRLNLELEKLMFDDAFEVLLELERFWKWSDRESIAGTSTYSASAKVIPSVDMRIVQKFLRCRQREFNTPEENDRRTAQMKPVEVESIPTGARLGFVHCLTQAELSYFTKRDLEKAHFWCKTALAIADEQIPSWVSKSDALYLSARVFERKNMPLDADYYYSLIPSFEKYDQWRIYGSPGKVLRLSGHEVHLNRGKLSLSDNVFLDLYNGVNQDFSHGIANSASNKTLNALLRAIYADDVSWSSAPLKLPGSTDMPFLHLLSETGPLEYLRIALHNPWIDIGQTDQHGNTALHGAAYKWNKEKVSLLIRSGANIRALKVNGDTPLHTMLTFAQGVKLENADIPGTLSHFFTDAMVAKGVLSTHPLFMRNKAGQTPIDVMKVSLMKELQLARSHAEAGYLKRFADAWEYLSKLYFCPSQYKSDSTLSIPAQREKQLRASKFGGPSMVSPTALDRRPLVYKAQPGSRREDAKQKEDTKRKKRFGIF